MWVGTTSTAHPKLIWAQIPAVDWIVQFDPPDDPRGMCFDHFLQDVIDFD